MSGQELMHALFKDDALDILYNHLMHHASRMGNTLRDTHCEVAMIAHGFPGMQIRSEVAIEIHSLTELKYMSCMYMRCTHITSYIYIYTVYS